MESDMLKKILCNFRFLKYKIKYKNYKKFNWNSKNALKVDLEISSDSKVDISDQVYFRKGCSIRVRDKAELNIGENVSFSDNCILTCREKIIIGDNVMFGPNTIIFDNDHDYKSEDFQNNFKTTPIIIENNVWIGGNVSILRGAHIKNGAVIGAGCVVNKVIEERNVCIGNRDYKKYVY